MDEVEKIYKALLSSDKTLVFTSETVARAALNGFIEHYPNKAVFKDRAISWDKFLLSILNTSNLRNVTKTERKIFAYSFLKKGGFYTLKHFVSQDHRESILNYAEYIASLLPYFPSPDDNVREKIDKDILFDMDTLRQSYTTFLDEKGLYERNYLTPDYSLIEKDRYIFVFPSTFTSNLTGKVLETGRVEVIECEENNNTPLVSYENSLSEIRWTMREIEKDRERYSDYDIAITSSSLSLYRPYMESEAKKRDITLIFTSSSPLSNYSEGEFLHSLYSTYSSSFSFREMKRFLLNPRYPFKDREKFVSIIREAVENKINDSWKDALGRENAPLMSEITKAVERIVKSRKAAETLSYIKEFRERFFVEGEWNEVDDPVFGSALVLLERMGEDSIEDLYPLFLSLIDETQYVERNEGKEGIRVYAYPASAGLITKVHYVIGLDDKTTQTRLDDYPFLTGERDDDVPEISNAILNIYRNTAFTEKLKISGTNLSFDGARLLPPLFLDCSMPENREVDDAVSQERGLWLEDIIPAEKPTKRMKESFLRAESTSLRGRWEDVFLPPFVDEKLSFSVSRIKDYDECPFKGFVSSRLKLDEKDYEPLLEDNRVIGEILHSTVERAIEKYKRIIDIDTNDLCDIFLEEIKKVEKKGKITTPYTASYIKGKFINKLGKISSCNKAPIYNTLLHKANEVKLDGYPLTGSITINGRIDTLLEDEEGESYIIDWKTSGKNDYSSKDINDTSLQIILYAILMGEEKIAGGAFFSFSDGDYRIVWPVETYYGGNGRAYSEGFPVDEVIKNAEERLELIKKNLEEGNFTPDYSEKNCTNCHYERLCRAKFVSKMERNDD